MSSNYINDIFYGYCLRIFCHNSNKYIYLILDIYMFEKLRRPSYL